MKKSAWETAVLLAILAVGVGASLAALKIADPGLLSLGGCGVGNSPWGGGSCYVTSTDTATTPELPLSIGPLVLFLVLFVAVTITRRVQARHPLQQPEKT